MTVTQKYCVRCGLPIHRINMKTAKYCSADCRQANAMEGFRARRVQGMSRLGRYPDRSDIDPNLDRDREIRSNEHDG